MCHLSIDHSPFKFKHTQAHRHTHTQSLCVGDQGKRKPLQAKLQLKKAKIFRHLFTETWVTVEEKQSILRADKTLTVWGRTEESYRRQMKRQTDSVAQSAHQQWSLLQGWCSAPSCQPCSVPGVGCCPPSVRFAPQFFLLLHLHLSSHLLHETAQSSPVPRLTRSLPSGEALGRIAIRSPRLLAASEHTLWQH